MGFFMLVVVALVVATITVAWYKWRRILAYCLTYIAQRSQLQLSIEALALSGASGIDLTLNKGILKAVTIRELQITRHVEGEDTSWWQGLASGTSRFKFQVSGVALTLGGASTKKKKPARVAEATEEHVAAASEASNTEPGGGGSSPSSSNKLKWLPASVLNMIILEARNVQIFDEKHHLMSVAEFISVHLGTQQQKVTATALTLGPAPTATGLGAAFFKLHYGELKHCGAFNLGLLASGLQLQTVLVDISDVSLDVSDEVLAWARQQKKVVQKKEQPPLVSIDTVSEDQSTAEAAEDRAENTAPNKSSSESQTQLGKARKLANFLPSKTEFSIAKWEFSCNASPIDAGLNMTGCTLQLVKTNSEVVVRHDSVRSFDRRPLSAGGGGSTTDTPPENNVFTHGGMPLGIATVGWQSLSCKLGAAGEEHHALSIKSSSADLCLQLLELNTKQSAEGELNRQQGDNDAFGVSLELGVNELHTCVHHEAVQPTLKRLKMFQKLKAKAASKHDDDDDKKQQQDVPKERKPPAASKRFDSLIKHFSEWHVLTRLGQGSSLRFLDSALEDVWWSSIESARLACSKNVLEPLSVFFEATDIHMHARDVLSKTNPSSAASSTDATSSVNVGEAKQAEQVLSTKRVQVQFQPTEKMPLPSSDDTSTPAAAEGDQPNTTTPPIETNEWQYKGSISAVGLTSLLQMQSLSALASVACRLAPAQQQSTSHRRTSLQHELQQRLPGSVVKTSTAPKINMSEFSFSFHDTMLALATSVVIPSEHSTINRVQIVNGTLAAAIDSVEGKVCRGEKTVNGQLEGGKLVYCEGLATQRFPSEKDSLLGHCKSTLLTINTFAMSTTRSEAAPSTAPTSSFQQAGSSSGGFDSWPEAILSIRANEVHALGDADGIGCAVQAADDVARAVSMVREAISFTDRNIPSASSVEGSSIASASDTETVSSVGDAGVGGSMERISSSLSESQDDGSTFKSAASGSTATIATTAAKQKKKKMCIQLALTSWKLSIPLPADLELSTEVDSAEIEAFGPGAAAIVVNTTPAALLLKGKPLIKWTQLRVAFHMPTTPAATVDLIPLGSALTPIPSLNLGTRMQSMRSDLSKDGSTSSSGMNLNISTKEENLAPPLASAKQPKTPLSLQRTPTSRPSTGALAQYAPYSRARLQPWLPSYVPRSNSAASPSPTGGAIESNAEVLGSGPRSMLDVACNHFQFIVPHDREPGSTERLVEMYIKAVKTAFAGSVKHITAFRSKRKNETNTQAKSKKAPSRAGIFPMQVNLSGSDITFKFEHHPMEAWFAVHGPLLRKMAVQRHAWSLAAATAQPAETVSSPLHAGIVESALHSAPETPTSAMSNAAAGDNKDAKDLRGGEESKQHQGDTNITGDEAASQAWEGIMQNLTRLYISETRQLATEKSSKTAAGRRKREADLLCIKAETLQALLVFCGTSTAASLDALEYIQAVDPASKGVELIKAQKIHLDVSAKKFSVEVATAETPLVSSDKLIVSGVAAIARQASVSPPTAVRVLPVGIHRRVPIDVSIRGYRAPFKFYTDICIDLHRMSTCYTPALEPTISLLAMAGKRLAPRDPDKSAARPPPVPWWDDLRYLWRGKTRIRASPFNLTLSTDDSPVVDDNSQRMQMSSATLDARLNSGLFDFALQGAQVTLFKFGSIEHPGGELLALPFIQAPSMGLKIKMDWVLPGGRRPDDHHLFPQISGKRPDAPLVVADVYKAEHLDLGIEFSFSPGGSNINPVGYMGDHQFRYIKEFIRELKSTPTWVKAALRRGTFFVRKPRGGPPKKGLPRLIRRFDLAIASQPLDLVHYTLDPEDASSGLRLSATSATFDGAFLLNQPAPSFLKLPPALNKGRKGSSQPVPNKSVCLHIEVEADTVKVTTDANNLVGVDQPQPSLLNIDLLGRFASLTESNEWPEDWEDHSLGVGDDDAEEPSLREQAPSLLWKLVDKLPPTPADRSVLTANRLTISRRPDGSTNTAMTAAAAGDETDPLTQALGHEHDRPLKVRLQDCRFFVDLLGRDAVWAAVVHLFSGLASSPLTAEEKAAAAGRAGGFTPLTAGGSRRSSSPFGNRPGSPVLGGVRHVRTDSRTGFGASRRNTAGSPTAVGFRSPSQSENLESNELLSLLLQQRGESTAVGGGDDGDDALTPRGTHRGQPGFIDEEDDDLNPDVDDEDEDEDDEGLMSTPLDDVQSVLRYELEVIHLQFNLQPEGDDAQGRLLLAAKSGVLRGLSLTDAATPLRITTLGLDEVQAYAAMTDVDPHASVTWLDVGENGFETADGRRSSLLRRIFNPICINLRHSKLPTTAALTTRRGLSTQPSLRALTPGTAGGLRYGAARGEELVLKIPEIVAVMDGREFEVVADVVNLLLAPGPQCKTLRSEELLRLESENEDVEDARLVFCEVRQQLNAFRKEAGELRRCLDLHTLCSVGVDDDGVDLYKAVTVRTNNDDNNGDDAKKPNVKIEEAAVNIGQTTRADDDTKKTGSPPSRPTDTGTTTTTATTTSDSGNLSNLPSLKLPTSPNAQNRRKSRSLSASGSPLEHPPTSLRRLSASAAGNAAGIDETGLNNNADNTQGGGAFGTTDGDVVSSPASVVDIASLPVATALREVFSGRMIHPKMPSSQAGMQREQRQRHELLLRWIQEQESGAIAAYTSSKTTLLSLKRNADAGKKSLHSSRVLVQLDRIVWQLCLPGPKRAPFVQASLKGLSLDRFKNRDRSGSAKFLIHRLEIKDATGLLQASPGTPAGVILAHWNPDASYERDPVLRLILTMGVPTASVVLYDHIDATIHPMTVHLTEQVAVACWEYFFPKEDSKQRQEAFTQSVTGTGKHRKAAHASGSMDPWAMAGAGTESPVESPTAAAAPSSGRHADRSNNPNPFSPDTSAPSTSTLAPYTRVGSTSHKDIVAQRRNAVTSQHRPKKKRFAYVKLNRAHFRITYEGYPLTIRDKILVVNSYTCQNLEGRWRDLLGQIKSKAILSAVWSGLGLQNRKIKELLEPTALPSVSLTTDDGRGAKGFLAKMGLSSKQSKNTTDQPIDEEDLKAMQKRRALFGDYRPAGRSIAASAASGAPSHISTTNIAAPGATTAAGSIGSAPSTAGTTPTAAAAAGNMSDLARPSPLAAAGSSASSSPTKSILKTASTQPPAVVVPKDETSNTAIVIDDDDEKSAVQTQPIAVPPAAIQQQQPQQKQQQPKAVARSLSPTKTLPALNIPTSSAVVAASSSSSHAPQQQQQGYYPSGPRQIDPSTLPPRPSPPQSSSVSPLKAGMSPLARGMMMARISPQPQQQNTTVTFHVPAAGAAATDQSPFQDLSSSSSLQQHPGRGRSIEGLSTAGAPPIVISSLVEQPSSTWSSRRSSQETPKSAAAGGSVVPPIALDGGNSPGFVFDGGSDPDKALPPEVIASLGRTRSPSPRKTASNHSSPRKPSLVGSLLVGGGSSGNEDVVDKDERDGAAAASALLGSVYQSSAGSGGDGSSGAAAQLLGVGKGGSPTKVDRASRFVQKLSLKVKDGLEGLKKQ